MKATGIVRRIDDLGRIVIPKEIRRTLRIRESDPLQTTLTGDENQPETAVIAGNEDVIYSFINLVSRLDKRAEKDIS